MNTGDTLTDSHGGSWVIDTHLGRGSWGRTWALRGDGGATAVLKAPLTAKDFPNAEDPEALQTAASQVAAAQRDAFVEGRVTFFPKLLGEVKLPHGVGLVLDHYDADMESRLSGGVALSEVLDLAVRILHQLAHATHGGEVHGNLRPSNVFVEANGRPVLTDPVLPSVAAQHALLERHAPQRSSYRPPNSDSAPNGSWDTWAVCLILYRAAIATTSSDDPRRGELAELPRQGLGRVALAAVKDAAAGRLRAESANKRFASRATERLGAVLNRGLSIETDPSPPFRFRSARDLLPRMVEVDDLVHPAVESVSKIMLSGAASGDIFETNEPVSFSVNVGTTAGVTQDDLACGVHLQDLDAPGDGRVRVRNSRFDVKRYPSGRWRFNFSLPDVTPGRYAIRVAFLVKDSSGQQPHVADGSFEVRPRPGYVPPPAPADAQAPPIPLLLNDMVDEGMPTEVPPTSPGRVVAFPGAHLDAPPSPVQPGRGIAAQEPNEPPGSFAEFPAFTSPHSAPPAVFPVAVAPAGPTPHAPRPDAMAPLPSVQPLPAVSPLSSVPAAHLDDAALPPTVPTIELPHIAADPLLHDYPPFPEGDDLPSYNMDDYGASASPVEQLRKWFDNAFSGDPLSILMASAGAGIILLVLVITLSKAC